MKIEDSGLRPDSQNANEGTQRGRGLLEKNLRKLGAGRSILADKNGNIIAGNKTIEGAAEIGLPVRIVETDGKELVVVKRMDLDLYSETDKRGRTLAYADNKVAELDLWWKPEQIVSDFEPLELGEWGFEDLSPAGGADAEPQIDRAAELNEKWQVKTGDLWQIGEHRLLCGDSTKREDVDRVMGGEKAELAPVDPPYNVGFAYDGETVDDVKTAEKYEEFSRAWFDLCRSVSGKQIVTPGGNNLALWLRWFEPYHWAPWTKSNSMTHGKVARFWCWEPVLFFGDKWKRKRANDLFDFPISNQQGVANHPCPKPLSMWIDLIENYSEEGEIIFESFSGSGTTIIACENLQRKCRAIEISPKYCAVILERMATAFPELNIERIEEIQQ